MSPTQTERDTPPRAYDDPDEEEYSMPHRYESAAAHHAGSDREISLGTGTILAIFFLLALVCSVFFGFGYTMGHKSNPLSTVAASEPSTRSLSEAFKAFKPAPGGTIAPTPAAKLPPTEDASATIPSSASVAVPATSLRSKLPTSPVASSKPFDPDAEIVTTVAPPSVAKTASSARTAPASHVNATDGLIISTAPSAGTIIVQVAAVSHQEDADTLIAALKRKGYAVAVHHEAQDKLLHIQLGPYPTKADAEAMRQRLQADNYNAILK